MCFFRDGHTAVFLSVHRPPPCRQNNLTNAMSLEQFSDLVESYISVDGLFVVGDLNFPFDKPSDPCTSALNVVLDNLSLHQLVKIPTHHHGHTLDWIITNCATDVLDLTVVDMLLLGHCVLSFNLPLKKKTLREKKKIISGNIRAIDMHVLGQVFITYLGQPLCLTQLIPSVFITHFYASCQLLDRHARLVTRTCKGPYVHSLDG